jgi:hypothetical protein
MRRICAALSGIALLAAGEAPAGLPDTFMPVVKCMYGVLKREPHVLGVEVFAFGDNHVLIEISYSTRSGLHATKLGVHNSQSGRYSYHGVSSSDAWGNEAEFLSPIMTRLEAACPLEQSLYTVSGELPPRRRIDMELTVEPPQR